MAFETSTLRLLPLAALTLGLGVGQDAATPTRATAAAASLPAPPASGEMGFAVVTFHPPNYNGDDSKDCPNGYAGKLRDSYLRTLPKAEQDRLNLKENEPERERLWKAYGLNANGGNICTNVYEFLDRPPIPMMTGPVAWGLDLDDDATGAGKDSYTCPHQNFTTPDGMKGADFQVWRVFGCSTYYRGTNGDGKGADLPLGYDGNMMTGQWTQVLILRGVNSLANDPDVEVIYANTDDRPVADASGRYIHKASFAVSPTRPQYRNVLHGRIVNGVLMTDSKDIRLTQDTGRAQQGSKGEFDLARSRIRLVFQPDGSAKGVLGGYELVRNVTQISRGGGTGSVNTAGTDCAGEYNALRMMADGEKDPKTGRCNRISTAFEFDAVPAFVNDLPPKALRITSK